MNIDGRTLGMLLICAERYALGRMTYIVDDVCNAIKCYMKDIERKDLYVLINDIENPALGYYKNRYDEEKWLDLLKTLKEEVSE